MAQARRRHILHCHDAWSVAHPAASPAEGDTWTVDNPAAAEEIDAIVLQPHYRRRLDYVVRTADLVLDRPIEQVQLSEHYGLSVDLDVIADPDRDR